MEMKETVDMLLQKRKIRIIFVTEDKGEFEYTRFDFLMLLKWQQYIPVSRYTVIIAQDVAARNGLHVRDEKLVQDNLDNTQLMYEISAEVYSHLLDIFEAYDLVQYDRYGNISLTEAGREALKKAMIRKDLEEPDGTH